MSITWREQKSYTPEDIERIENELLRQSVISGINSKVFSAGYDFASPTSGMTMVQIIAAEKQLVEESKFLEQLSIVPMKELELCPLCKEPSPEKKICAKCLTEGINESDKWMKKHGGH